ncbi:MAG: septal ring lytic transglycosylase RlpA family protein [Burkholderiaceae bacterium]|nr:septal ring lytic transglycosylase RlpA family protein [Burkholderiaceae bacterium]
MPGPDPDTVADAVPRPEALAVRASRPYVVFERQYVPMTSLEPFRERGVASWYGRRYHGRRTSIGEVYDMHKMTGAHPTLPLPSYVRVTHTGNGRSVVVRLNDRGPFLHGRVIDLSYVAAAKLGYVDAGSAEVDVELITRFDDAPGAERETPPALVASAAGDLGARAAGTTSAPAAGATTVPAAGAVSAPTAADTSATAAGDTGAHSPPFSPVRLEFETIAAPNAAPLAGEAPPTAPPTASPTAPPTAPPQAAMPDPAPVVMQAQAPLRGAAYFLQLGAFSSRANALAARERIAQAASLAPLRIALSVEDGLHKLRYGPFPARAQALLEAQRIRTLTGGAPFLIDR